MIDIREELALAIKRAGTGKPYIGLSSDGPWREWDLSLADAVLPIIERRIAAARAEERERCAKVAEELRHPNYSSESEDWVSGTWHAAAAIRALDQ